jgi:hypothetical protein
MTEERILDPIFSTAMPGFKRDSFLRGRYSQEIVFRKFEGLAQYDKFIPNPPPVGVDWGRPAVCAPKPGALPWAVGVGPKLGKLSRIGPNPGLLLATSVGGEADSNPQGWVTPQRLQTFRRGTTLLWKEGS